MALLRALAVERRRGDAADGCGRERRRDAGFGTQIALDLEKEFTSGTSVIKASASKGHYSAGDLLQIAPEVLAGKKPAEPVVLLDPKSITVRS